MNIYFAGSIRGGRTDQNIYLEIIKYLQKFGTVLTEHVANPNTTSLGEKISEEKIFKRDMKWLKKADIMVAEVTNPSLGVGYELAMAEKMNKKILCLYRPSRGKSLSAMVRGNIKFKVIDYKTLKDARKIIDKFIKSA